MIQLFKQGYLLWPNFGYFPSETALLLHLFNFSYYPDGNGTHNPFWIHSSLGLLHTSELKESFHLLQLKPQLNKVKPQQMWTQLLQKTLFGSNQDQLIQKKA